MQGRNRDTDREKGLVHTQGEGGGWDKLVRVALTFTHHRIQEAASGELLHTEGAHLGSL